MIAAAFYPKKVIVRLSDFNSNEFAKFVVECGIQTMSLNPDTVIKTTLAVAELEAIAE
jgi:phosphoenolpyruvate synthase/pyruvate phosphate dikinase